MDKEVDGENPTIPACDRYGLTNAHIPTSLIENSHFPPQTREGLCCVDLEITRGQIAQILPAGTLQNIPTFDLHKGIIVPCFIDLHTHLDKGHIWERSPNPDCTFESAIAACKADAKQSWQTEDLYRRMEFSLQCSYAHGTQAIRTHIDAFGEQAEISLRVFKHLQQEWQDKLILQAVSLVSLDYFLTSDGVKLADRIADIGGILGGVAYTNPDLDAQLDAVFCLAQERHLSLDFHVDENGDRNSICLRKVAETALRYQFPHPILCGHCCSLAVQSPEAVAETLNLVRQANIGIVSLPMCNLYLQDREPGKTPFWRGIPPVREIEEQGIPLAFASDNCRDPFFGFGDLDVLEVFEQAVRIAHLDTPYSHWINAVTQTPANLMGLTELGRIGEGSPANLILFKGRYFSELLARSQRDRIVLRSGQPIDTTLPDYSVLDDLVLGY